MLALRRDLGTQYKTAFVLAHKIREAMASEVRRSEIGGQGKRGRGRWRLFRRLRQASEPPREPPGPPAAARTRSGKRKVVVVIRERGGKTLPGVFESEVAALNFIRRQVPRETDAIRG